MAADPSTRIDATHIDPTPKTPRRGGQPGNRCAASSGLRMRLSGWPPGTRDLENSVYRFRVSLRAECIEKLGTCDQSHERAINVACEHDKRRLLLGRQLRLKGADWSDEQVDRNTAATTGAAERRDAIVKEMLGQKPEAIPVWQGSGQ